MKCIICHGDDISMQDVNEEMPAANDVIYVPVRVLVCGTCGERYYDRRTVRYLEEIERELRSGTARLKDIGKVRVLSQAD